MKRVPHSCGLYWLKHYSNPLRLGPVGVTELIARVMGKEARDAIIFHVCYPVGLRPRANDGICYDSSLGIKAALEGRKLNNFRPRCNS